MFLSGSEIRASDNRSPTRLFSREGLLCAAVLAVCLLLTWPVAEIGIDDDWCYALIAWDYARTGHMIFHGWASPVLGWQAIWGGLAARIFGSTFTTLRISLLPVTLGIALLYHAILRRFGLNPMHAIFGALVFVLSPVFLPMADVFMTDITSIFAILVCLYFCQLALAAKTDRTAVLWLVAAAASNVSLGTVRQIAWLGVLVIVPSCGWLLRKKRGVPVVTAALWAAGALCVVSILHWFNHQPYTAPEQILSAKLDIYALRAFIGSIWRTVLELLLFVLPVLATALAAVSRLKKPVAAKTYILFGIFVAIAAALYLTRGLGKLAPPWVGNVVTAHGFLATDGLFTPFPAAPPLALFLVLVFFLLCVFSFGAALLSFSTLPASTTGPALRIPVKREINLLLLPFLACYCLTLMPRAAFAGVFDRYLLEILLVLLVYVLRWHQERLSQGISLSGWLTLLAFTFVAVAGTHDVFAMNRARAQVLQQAQDAGVPRTALRGEFEFDAVTEVQEHGYLNDRRILIPKNAYKQQKQANEADPCDYWFAPYTPAVHARFAIAATPSTPCLDRSSFAPVSYRTWLPPATRQLFVDRIPTESKAALTP